MSFVYEIIKDFIIKFNFFKTILNSLVEKMYLFIILLENNLICYVYIKFYIKNMLIYSFYYN